MANNQPVQIPISNIGNEAPQMYADGAAQVHVMNDMVKIELFTHIPAGNEKINAVITGRVIMPLEAYLNMFELMKDINQKLIANGTIEEAK